MSASRVSTHTTRTSHNKSNGSSDFSAEIVSTAEAVGPGSERREESAIASDEDDWSDIGRVNLEDDIGPDDSASTSRPSTRTRTRRKSSRTKVRTKARATSQHSAAARSTHPRYVPAAPEVDDAPAGYGEYARSIQPYSRVPSVMAHYPDPGVPNPFAPAVPDSMVPYGYAGGHYRGPPLQAAPGAYYNPAHHHSHRVTSPYDGPQQQVMYAQPHPPPGSYPFPPGPYQFAYTGVIPGAFAPSTAASTTTPHETTPSPAPSGVAGPSKEELELQLLKEQYEKLKAAADARAVADAKAEAEAKTAAEKAEVKKAMEELMEKALEKKEKEAKEKEEELEKKAAKDKEAAVEEAVREAAKPKNAPKDPVKFKDAVGRKFTLPFELVRTWQGMDSMIQQAFSMVLELGPRVVAGQYDLLCDGQIIMPLYWEQVIKPDDTIEMKMWPLPPPPPGTLPQFPGAFPGPPVGGSFAPSILSGGPPLPPAAGAIPVPPLFGTASHPPPGIEILPAPAPEKKKKKPAPPPPKKGFLGGLFATAPPPKKGKKPSGKK